MLIIHILGQENACCRYLGILVMLQHRPDALIAHQLNSTLGIIGSQHGSGCLIVDVDAVIDSHHGLTEKHAS